MVVAASYRRYSVNTFIDVQKQADANKDGKLTKEEFKDFKEERELMAKLGQLNEYGFVQSEAMRIMDQNFDAIAYRALKNGEITTMDFRETDRTIEVGDINKLAGFDGNAKDITIDDVQQLTRGNTANWKIAPWGEVPIEPPVTPKPPKPAIPAQLQQILQLILLLLLSGLFKR